MISQNPDEKICLWASMITINVPVAICQFTNFLYLEKGLLPRHHVNLSGGALLISNTVLTFMLKEELPLGHHSIPVMGNFVIYLSLRRDMEPIQPGDLNPAPR